MYRKFVLVAGLALFDPGSVTQLMLAQLVCFFYVVLVVNTAPYKKDEADFTNQASVASPVFTAWRRRLSGRVGAPADVLLMQHQQVAEELGG